MAVCTHLDQVKDVSPNSRRLRGVPADGGHLGPPAPLPDLRPRRLLRFLEEQARHQALPRHQHPIVQSFEPGEDWVWCYVDEVFLEE